MKTIINIKNIEEFETSRLHARKISENDFDLILPMYQNLTVMETLGGVVPEHGVKKRFLRSLAGWEKIGFKYDRNFIYLEEEHMLYRLCSDLNTK